VILSPKKTQGVLSLLILTCLVLQTLAAFRLMSHRMWPFLAYPMYDKPHFKDEPMARHVIVAIFADGREEDITPESLGLNLFQYMWGPVDAIHFDDRATLRKHLAMYMQKTGKTPSALRLENRALRLGEAGVEEQHPEPLKTIPLEDLPRP